MASRQSFIQSQNDTRSQYLNEKLAAGFLFSREERDRHFMPTFALQLRRPLSGISASMEMGRLVIGDYMSKCCSQAGIRNQGLPFMEGAPRKKTSCSATSKIFSIIQTLLSLWLVLLRDSGDRFKLALAGSSVLCNFRSRRCAISGSVFSGTREPLYILGREESVSGKSQHPLHTYTYSYMSDPVQMLYIPQTMVNWPWPREINPHYKEISAESNAWFHSFKAFSERSQLAFDKCDFGWYFCLKSPSSIWL